MRGIREVLALAFCCLAGGVIADDGYPVDLEIEAANSKDDIIWLSESGWPVTIKMVVKAEDMIGYAKHSNWTNKGRFGFILFEDPDGCPWMDDADWRSNIPPASCEPYMDETFEVLVDEDETYLEFRPDVDEAGMPDLTGDADERVQLVDSAGSGGPEFQRDDAGLCVPGTGDSACTKFGPPTGGEVEDGFGYGNDDDLPGLFLYIEAGTGLLYDEPDFDLSSPKGVRNLAGMLNSVTYELSDLRYRNEAKENGQRGKPSQELLEEARVWAHMNVPGQLVRNIMQYDACTGDSVLCDGSDAWRIDGGPTETPPEVFGRGDAASIYQFDQRLFTIHAFMVSGHAPDSLVDANGDGDYTDDAALAGFKVISNVDSVDLIQLSNVLCFGGGGSVMNKDLDANGESTVPIVCPTGPGDVERPPR